MAEWTFEWDEAKSQKNLAKHGVPFVVACRVFEDIFALDRIDLESCASEARYVIGGMVEGILLQVVYTEREDRIRIISARKATKHEEAEYYRSQTAE